MASAPTLTDEDPSIIRALHGCFEAAMYQAGKTAPEGMGAETCQCFIEQVFQGQGIERRERHAQQRLHANTPRGSLP